MAGTGKDKIKKDPPPDRVTSKPPKDRPDKDQGKERKKDNPKL